MSLRGLERSVPIEFVVDLDGVEYLAYDASAEDRLSAGRGTGPKEPIFLIKRAPQARRRRRSAAHRADASAEKFATG